MKRKAYNGLIILLISIVMTSCVTAAGYQELMQSWIGSTEDNLISSWGIPDKTYESDGKKFLTYIDDLGSYTSQSSQYNPYFGVVTSSNTSSRICHSTFIIQDKRVVNYTSYGNHCLN